MNDLRLKSVERKKKVEIIVNGNKISAYEGETLLSALIAAGFRVFRKSSVSGEPRGGLCGMGVCYDCLVTVNNIKNIRSCMTYVKDGIEVKLDD